MVEMERRADVQSDCTEENKGVKMRGGDRGWRGSGGEKERERERADNEFRQKERGHLHYK